MRISRLMMQLILLLSVVMLFNACIIKQLMPVPRLEPGVLCEVAPENKFVRIDTDVPGGVLIHYRDYPGDGENIVLIHGFASSTYTWEDMVIELQKHYAGSGKKPHILAIDMKGFGWSDKPINAKYDPFALSDDVNTWMNKLGINNATVVGNSLGGGVAGILTLDHPEKVKRLVLIDSGGYAIDKKDGIKFADVPFTRITARLLFSRPLVKEILHSAFYDPTKVTEPRVDAYFNRMRTWGAINSQVLMMKSLGSERVKTYGERIKEIKKPTLIIWGRDDTWIPLQCGRRFNCDIKGSKLVIIPQSRHVSQEEHPDKVADLLYRFLEGLPIQSVATVCAE